MEQADWWRDVRAEIESLRRRAENAEATVLGQFKEIEGLVHYAKMLEDRCEEMAEVIRRYASHDQHGVRKLTSFETAEFIYNSSTPEKE